MRENYTKNAQEAIRLAKSASRHNKQNYTGTEHLLLGLIAEPDGVASKVLRDNNCTLERLNDMIAQLNIRSANLALLDHEGFSPRCQKIMRIAGNLAEQYNSEQVGTEHLLLAIITEGENIALKLIETLGISPPKLYFETLAAIGEDPAAHKDDLRRTLPRRRKSEDPSPIQQRSDKTREAGETRSCNRQRKRDQQSDPDPEQENQE